MKPSPLSEQDIDFLSELGQRLINHILSHEPLESIKFLVESGAPLWYQNEEGISPLHAAAYVQNDEVTQLLINAGALWNAVDFLQNTAADIALSFNNEVIYSRIRNAGIRAELLFTLLTSQGSSPDQSSDLVLRPANTTAAASTEAFLSSRLKFTKDPHGQEICLLDVGDQEIGVMMGWESEIMQETVIKLCNNHEYIDRGLKILNIGFGLGMIDTLFQSLPTPPSQHIIVEPHPDVLQHMKDLGWYDKKYVKILEGKWQDFVDSNVILDIGGFDVIYTDTFSENYKDLHQFFTHIPELLADSTSRFGFFNGLGATNALFYDVYTHLSELHLADIGIDVEWSEVDLGNEEKWGKTREYFTMPLYRLPVCKIAITAQ